MRNIAVNSPAELFELDSHVGPQTDTAAGRCSPAPPLCVDLNGTLILGDLLLESLFLLLKRNPLYVFLVPFWLIRGRAVLKAEIAARVTIDPQALAYDREFVRWLQSEHAAGRHVWLCTASNEQLACRVAAHIGLFDGILASDHRINLVGATKATRLVEQFGEHGFDYCGNEGRDLAVWRRARGAIVVHGSARLRREAASRTHVVRAFPPIGHTPQAVLRAMRPHQWAKNALVLVPLFAAHRAAEFASVAVALLAVGAFCLSASSAYVLNDLLDLQADRVHSSKSKRPFAAGELSLLTGVGLTFGLLGAASLIAVFLPGDFQVALATYYALTLGYSLGLKKLVMVDAFALAGLYTLRIVAGAAAVNIPLSFWLLLFSVFIFLSLALVKRFAELDALRRQQRLQAAGRGYTVDDLPMLRSLGSAAGYLSVVVLALYINSPDIEALYRRPKAIWMLCVLVLYWISRIWMTAQRGAMHDDPVVFALKDRTSLALGLLSAVTVAVAV